MAKAEYKYNDRVYVLDIDKAKEAIEGKKVINGKRTEFFNLLPLKYVWAYDLYKKMKANHWEPEDIPMHRDVFQYQNGILTDLDKWVVHMTVGYFSAAEGIVGDNIIHVVRDIVTTSELKLVLGRHAHEENIHADSLLYIISSLGIEPYECEAMFVDIPSIKKKNEFVTSFSYPLRIDDDMTKYENKVKLLKNMFVYGLVMEGTQFYSLFAMILSLYRQNKIPGIAQMIRYTMRDESNHIQLFTNLILELVKENPEIWNDDTKKQLSDIMKQGVELEEEFIHDVLPMRQVGLDADSFVEYIKYISNRRMENIGLEPLYPEATNTMPWLSELMDLRKEQNFFEGRVTEYKKASSLVDDL